MNSFGYKFIQFYHRIASRKLSPSVLLVSRSFSRSSVLKLKEIVKQTSEDGKTITIEGLFVTSPRGNKLITTEKVQQKCSEQTAEVVVTDDVQKSSLKPCPLCRLGLEIKHTDVLILSQFLDPNGNLLGRKTTRLCLTQHRRMDYLVQMAKLAGILKLPTDPEPKKRPGYMKYNKYYDESVIDEFFAGTRYKA